MKKLILITLVLTLAMSIVWVPSIAVAQTIPITIHKTIPAGGPLEAFTFEAYRDMNNNGIIDFVNPWPDVLVGQVVIVGAGTGVIDTPLMGQTIIHEVLSPGSAYQQLPDQIVQISCPAEVTFNNELGEKGKLIIKKVDGAGNALAGATFVITPDPKTGTGSLTVVDNGLNDEDPAGGVLLVTGCIIGTVCTVEETVAPPGYVPAPPQTVTISATVTLTFVNTPKELGGTPGYWASPAAVKQCGKTTLAAWFKAIVLDSGWFDDSLAIGTPTELYNNMRAILKNKGAKGYTGAVNQFRNQYLATRLNVLAGRLGLGTSHDISGISGDTITAPDYFGFSVGTLQEIINFIETQDDADIWTPPPSRDEILIMKSVCDLVNNP